MRSSSDLASATLLKAIAQLPCILAFALVVGAPISAHAQSDYVPPKIETSTPTGIALSDGSFIYDNTDISIGPLTLERFHLGGAQDKSGAYFGPFMSHNFDIFVSPNPHRHDIGPPGTRYKPIVHLGRGASDVFFQTCCEDASFVISWTPDSMTENLTFSSASFTSGDYQYTAHDGTIYNFTHTVVTPSGSQRIASIIYRGGRTLTFSYVNGRPKLIVDNSGYALVFDYAGTVVSAACGFNLATIFVTTSTTCAGAPLRVSYGYTNGFLTSITDVMGNITTLTNTGLAITCIRPPGHAACRIANTYATFGQIIRQTLGDGSVWNFFSTRNLSRDADTYLLDDGLEGTIVTNPLNQTQNYRFTGSSPWSFTDALGRVTQYRYSNNYDTENDLAQAPPPNNLHDGRLLESATFPEGNTYTAVYAGPFRSISQETFAPPPGDPTPPAVIQYIYGPCTNLQNFCTQPIARIDPRGARTDFAYTSAGLIQSEMQPAPTAGAPRPLKLYTYSQRFAYVRNAGGALVQAASPIWVIMSETQCQTVAGGVTPVCDAAGPSTVTDYQYGPNGTATSLLPVSITTRAGNNAVTATRTMTYNDFGDVTSVDGPRTDVIDISFTTYDAMRRKVFEIGPDPDGAGPLPRTITRHFYSPDGNEIRTEMGSGAATNGSDFVAQQYRAMTYDAMGRLLRTEEGLP